MDISELYKFAMKPTENSRLLQAQKDSCMRMGQVFEQIRETSKVELSLIKVALLQSQLTQI